MNRISYVAQKVDIDFNFPITVRECISGLYPKTKFFKRLSKSDWSKVTDALTLLAGLNDLAHRQQANYQEGNFNVF